jgi:hypothetical protein
MARRWALVGVVVLTVAAAVGPLHLLLARPAGAAVVHQTGFMGTVDGYSGWYGSYGMGSIGTAWCVDHGIPAPDADLDYQPAELTERAPSTRTAIAWALGRYGTGSPDAVTAAALTLTLHDLMGAAYPGGPLQVDNLDARGLAGFNGQGAAVLDRARQLRADAVAHSQLQPPLSLTIDARPVEMGAVGTFTVKAVDATGSPVAGITIHLDVTGARLNGAAEATTGSDGAFASSYTAALGPNHFVATATVPDLSLKSFAPRAAIAQRVARPATVPLRVETGFTTVLHHELRLHKTGDDEHYLPVSGAKFEVHPADGGPAVATLMVDGHGDAAPVVLPAGRYEVVEVTAPDGYALAEPVAADLTGGDVTVAVADKVKRGSANVIKTDSATGHPLAGARLTLLYEAGNDGRYGTEVGSHLTSLATPLVISSLLPGHYALREDAPPPGYQLTSTPVTFSIPPGGTTSVTMADKAIPPTPPPSAPPTPKASPPTPSPPSPPPTVLSSGPTLPVTGIDVRRLLGVAAILLGLGLGLISGATWGSAAGPRRRSGRGPPERPPRLRTTAEPAQSRARSQEILL